MKKIIKFRGERIDNGAIVSGKDFKSVRGDFFISDGVNWFQVIPDSVAQFVGYDKFGAELYDGDKNLNCESDTLIVYLSPYFLPVNFKPDSIKQIGDSFQAFSKEV